MKQAKQIILINIANLFKVKSIITVIMTLGLVALLFIPNLNPPKEIITLYCTSYGSIMAYFFSKKDKDTTTKNIENIEESEGK